MLLMEVAVEESNLEIIQLLAKRGASLNQRIAATIFKPEKSDYIEKTVAIIFQNVYSISRWMLFIALLESTHYKGSSASSILIIMLENGMPIDDFRFYLGKFSSNETPLHVSISKNRIDIVRI